MDPHKVKAITDWPTPTTKRELQQFLGFVNFYRRFVKGFAKIAKPLTKLTGKTDWLWTELQQKVFQELKNEVTSERVLIIPKPGRPFRMETDASDFAIAAIVTTRYGLLHYANLIRRTGPYCFSFNLLNLATPLLSYAVRLVLLIVVLLSSLPCYLYDAVLILTSDILYSLIDTFLSILRYINTHVFVVEP
jgi:hypothetical protein